MPWLGQQVGILLGEIVADHGDQTGFREIARGQGNIGGRAAEHAIHAAVRRFDAVIGDRANYDKRHFLIVADGESGLRPIR